MGALAKSSNDKVLYGVCGGLAGFFGLSSFVVRLLFLLTFSVSLWIYIVLIWKLDEKPTQIK